MKASLMASASSFAHLLGRAPKATKAEEEDDKKKSKRAEDNLDDEKGDGDDEGDAPKDGKKGKKARAEDTERDEEEDERKERDEEEEGDDAKKSKKAKAKRARADDEGDDGESGDDDEEGDDGSDGADMRKKGARSARLRERARCAAIFADAAAGKNPALAAQLAFATDLPRSQAVNVLRAGGLAVASTPRRPTLDERMAAVKVPVIGAGDASPPAAATGLAAQIVAAGKKRRGEA